MIYDPDARICFGKLLHSSGCKGSCQKFLFKSNLNTDRWHDIYFCEAHAINRHHDLIKVVDTPDGLLE